MSPHPFSQTGGVLIGEGLYAFNASWPFATLFATETGLSLSYPFRVDIFPRASIRRLSRYGAFLSSGLRIDHAVPLYPASVVFWTFNFKRLKAELERLGYHVED